MARKSKFNSIAIGAIAIASLSAFSAGITNGDLVESTETITTKQRVTPSEYLSIKAEQEKSTARQSIVITEEPEAVTIAVAEPLPSKEVITTAETNASTTRLQIPETTAKAVTTKKKVPVSTTTAKPADKVERTVYWTENGSVYHNSSTCRTLKRSKNVYKGTIKASGKPRSCKVCGSGY